MRLLRTHGALARTLLAGETKERYDAFLSLWERVELEDLTGAELTRSVHCCDQND